MDEAIVFSCAGESLVGILSRPAAGGDTGLVVVVGGPQYRAGSHRQFVVLARRLANEGVAVLRFDYRGMGDSSGAAIAFERSVPDIGAAIDALLQSCATVKRVVLWGLCDGASAALLYLEETRDPRVTGVCILNPWVRSAATLARTQVKHYYGQRLLQREFWLKLARGGVDFSGSFRELIGKLRLSAMPGEKAERSSFQSRMARGLREFRGGVLLLLSAEDYTAKEFIEYAGGDADWGGILAKSNIHRVDVAGADHTFSNAEWRERAERETLDWLRGGLTKP